MVGERKGGCSMSHALCTGQNPARNELSGLKSQWCQGLKS